MVVVYLIFLNEFVHDLFENKGPENFLAGNIIYTTLSIYNIFFEEILFGMFSFMIAIEMLTNTFTTLCLRQQKMLHHLKDLVCLVI